MKIRKSLLQMICLGCFILCGSFFAEANDFKFSGFGQVKIYQPRSTPKEVVLFISGDGGWEKEDNLMASYLAQQGALVAGIDAKYYRNSLQKQRVGCYYPAGDFEQLSMALQKNFAFPSYFKPVLAGYSYGATLVYGLLAQAPAGTFKAGIGLGFCPDMLINKPLCKGAGLLTHKLKKGYYLEAVPELSAPFLVLNGTQDQVCDFNTNRMYLAKVGNSKLIPLPAVGHGFSNQAVWQPKLRLALQIISDLNHPHMLYQSKNSSFPTMEVLPSSGNDKHHLVFFISGDGGWTSFDQGLSKAFSRAGFSVLGLDAQKYFWKKKTAKESADAITGSIQDFLSKHPQKEVSIMGFSFGACVLPFISSQIMNAKLINLKHMILLSPDRYADFEIRIADMLSFGSKQSSLDVIKECAQIKQLHQLCLFGAEEEQAVIRSFQQAAIPTVVLPGGHHYNNNYDAIVKQVQKLNP